MSNRIGELYKSACENLEYRFNAVSMFSVDPIDRQILIKESDRTVVAIVAYTKALYDFAVIDEEEKEELIALLTERLDFVAGWMR